MIGIDTNVLVRYLLRDDEPAAQAAARVFDSLTIDRPGFITQVVMAEVYWVMSRGYKVARADCLAMVRGLIETDTLEFDDGEGVVRALTLAEQGADFGDALIQGALELFGIDEMVTFDRAAAKKLGWRLLRAV